jgi:mannose-6-phosphate isomerase-like protein (cupin superfamily)
MTSEGPGRVAAEEVNLRTDTADGGFTVGVAIDRKAHDSELWFGVGWLEPGTEPVSWSADNRTFEAYYVFSGSLKVDWSGPTIGTEIIGSEDCFYFAPDHTYTIENAGSEKVFIVWTVTPSPAE